MGQQKEETLKEKWEKLYSSVGVDGFHYLFETVGIRRLFWALLLTVMLGFSIILFLGNIKDFREYKTVTSKEEIFEIEKLEFPTVTICNMNSVSEKKLSQTKINISQKQLIDFYQELRDGKLDMNNNTVNHIVDTLKEANITTLRQVISMFELGINEMLHDNILNTFINQPCKFNNHECDGRDFIPIVSETYGLCFQYHSFESGNRIYANDAGEGSGLHLYLNIHEDDMLVSRVPYQGLTVFIHPFGTPFESAISKRVPVQPGSMTFIHIKLNYLELLPAPYATNCSSKPYNYVRSDVPYTQSMCSIDCVMTKMIDKCGCVSLEMFHHTDKVEVCSLDKVECIEHIMANATTFIQKCRHNCPIECKYTRYDLDSAQTRLGNKIVIEKMKEHSFTKVTATEYIKNNIVGIDIAFSDIAYIREIVSPAVNWEGLLGAVGGNLGLCLGCSLITVIEFIIFGLDAVCKKSKELLSSSKKKNIKIEKSTEEEMNNMIP